MLVNFGDFLCNSWWKTSCIRLSLFCFGLYIYK